MTEEVVRKPLRCRMGLHHWTRDSAFFSSVVVCMYCDKPTEDEDAARLALERELWAEAQQVMGLGFEAQRDYVATHLYGIGLERVPPRPQ